MAAHNFDTLTASLSEGTRAAAVIGGRCKTYPLPVAFRVDGRRCSLQTFLADNADDAELCEWACSANPGDVFPALVSCECIADDGAAAKAAAEFGRIFSHAYGLERNDDRYSMVGGGNV